MSATAGSAAGQHGLAEKLGIVAGAVVQEVGWDDDCDEDLRRTIVAASGQELVDDEYDDVVDVVLIWWRDGDGDLVEGLRAKDGSSYGYFLKITFADGTSVEWNSLLDQAFPQKETH